MQASPSIHGLESLGVDAAGRVEEALGAKEECAPWLVGAWRELERRPERVFGESLEPELRSLRPSLLVEAQRPRQSLDDRRLAAAVLAHQEGDRRVELQTLERLYRGHGERELRLVYVRVRRQPRTQKVRAGAEGSTIWPRHVTTR